MTWITNESISHFSKLEIVVVGSVITGPFFLLPLVLLLLLAVATVTEVVLVAVLVVVTLGSSGDSGVFSTGVTHLLGKISEGKRDNRKYSLAILILWL